MAAPPNPSFFSTPSAAETSTARIASVVLLCGLPASGKSTVAAAIERHFARISGDSAQDGSKFEQGAYCRVVRIEYDVVARSIASNHSDGAGGTDMTRVQDGGFSASDLVAWREARNTALELLETELRSHFAGRVAASVEWGQDSFNDSLLVIMDDNFHLRSMRRDVYRVCQSIVSSWSSHHQPLLERTGGKDASTTCTISADATSSPPKETPDVASTTVSMLKSRPLPRSRKIGFSVIMVNASTAVCIERNAARPDMTWVPDEVIRNMSETLEWPDPAKAKFESSTATISTQMQTQMATPFLIPAVLGDEELSIIGDCLNAALVNPVCPRPPDIDPDSVRRERAKTLQSHVHRYDRMLRALVGALCQADKSSARSANAARKALLMSIKEGDCLGGGSKHESSVCFENRSCDDDGLTLDDRVLERFIELALAGRTNGDGCNPTLLRLAKVVQTCYDAFQEEYPSFVTM